LLSRISEHIRPRSHERIRPYGRVPLPGVAHTHQACVRSLGQARMHRGLIMRIVRFFAIFVVSPIRKAMNRKQSEAIYYCIAEIICRRACEIGCQICLSTVLR